MESKEQQLGRLVAVHGIAPVYIQRAVFMAVLSFLFFIAMMFAFYVLQSALYFLLSTAFLIIYLLTMFSFLMQRKKSVEVYENGLKYKKETSLFSEISTVDDSGTVSRAGAKPIVIPTTIYQFETLISLIRKRSTEK